jgi:hypothetical protein
MEKLGLLAGTPNRHLNGMWLVHEGEIPPPGQPQPQEPPLPPSREQLILLLEKLDRLEALLARLLDK